MNYYHITGTSRGIGKALAELLLQDASNKVIGISRECTIDHPNYQHLTADLSDIETLLSFEFEPYMDATKMVLINNAGTLADVKPVGNLKSKDIVKGFNVNLLAPTILMNKFIADIAICDIEKIILNISSGAGKNPVDGWSVYCAGKAGLDMFSRVIDKEQQLKEGNKVKVYSIAPGVVDTYMQDEIRKVAENNFSRLAEFKNLKENNQLSNPKTVAEKYIYLLNNTDKINGVLDSLREH